MLDQEIVRRIRLRSDCEELDRGGLFTHDFTAINVGRDELSGYSRWECQKCKFTLSFLLTDYNRIGIDSPEICALKCL